MKKIEYRTPKLDPSQEKNRKNDIFQKFTKGPIIVRNVPSGKPEFDVELLKQT